MIVDPFVQLRLLDLQAVDTSLSQLDHRRRSLPELAVIDDAQNRAAAVRAELVEAETTVADLTAAQRRLENDIDSVRLRAAKDQDRIGSAGVPAKEVAGLQHEVASLARRQGVLEDELLELMENVEQAEHSVTQLQATADAIAAQRAAAEHVRDEVLAELSDADQKYRQERQAVAAGLPAELLALYEKVAAANGGVGAAMLRQRRCEGCRLELAGNELADVRHAKAEEVLRCENCRRILIRTHESGL